MVPEIFDPVAGCIYYFDVANKIAHRVELPQPIRILIPPQGMIIQIAMPPMILPGSGKSPPPPPVGFSEELGTQMVEGIEIHGRRTTTTYAAGTMGNDRPVSTITELWTSPDLNIMISSKISDPRQGETISMLRNISLAEPDAALFQVPPGYRVIDETGPFTITINRVPDTK
ncbi:MAG TPA: hypothetical protein VLL97_02700 [Acidobacteriota bacterium]|nr:hypothetical protein [Acidobacteriota bacterium]